MPTYLFVGGALKVVSHGCPESRVSWKSGMDGRRGVVTDCQGASDSTPMVRRLLARRARSHSKTSGQGLGTVGPGLIPGMGRCRE